MSAKPLLLCLFLVSPILVCCSEIGNPPNNSEQKVPMDYPSDSDQSADGIDVLHLPAPQICSNLPVMTEECQMGSDGNSLQELCQVSNNAKIPEKTMICGKGLLKYQAYLCTLPWVSEADMKNIRCTTVTGSEAKKDDAMPLTYPSICKELPAMTLECQMDKGSQPLKEVCHVEGNSAFSEKTYGCGKGAFQHQAYLCNFPTVTDSDLKNIRCIMVSPK